MDHLTFSGFLKPEEVFRPRKVLILGSGGLSIGQAGEFDYSGSQVCNTTPLIQLSFWKNPVQLEFQLMLFVLSGH